MGGEEKRMNESKKIKCPHAFSNGVSGSDAWSRGIQGTLMFHEHHYDIFFFYFSSVLTTVTE